MEMSTHWIGREMVVFSGTENATASTNSNFCSRSIWKCTSPLLGKHSLSEPIDALVCNISSAQDPNVGDKTSDIEG